MKKHRSRKTKIIAPVRRHSAPATVAALLLLLSLFFAFSAQVRGQELILLEQPFPSSVDDDVTPIEVSLKEYVFSAPMFPSLKQQLKDAPAFFRDMQLDFNTRSYYFYRDRFDSSVNEAWAMGAAFYTAQRLYGPKDRDADLQRRPAWSFLNGFSARLRYARVQQYQGPRDTLHEYRAIFNYDFGLL